MNAPRPRLILALILGLYLMLGILFAANTPPWQAPDEPAHYNYVRYLAEQGTFPVLHMGDYPHAYLEEIKSRRFPPDLSIDPIRYEFHQPPLYYALAAPIYGLTGGDPFSLRLFSVALGAGIVILAYAIARRAFPARPALALGTAAFVAFLPQHLATVAQIGNDVLAELLYAAVLFVLVGRLMQPTDTSRHNTTSRINSILMLGFLLGLMVSQIGYDVLAGLLSAAVLFMLAGWFMQHLAKSRHNIEGRTCNILELGLGLGPPLGLAVSQIANPMLAKLLLAAMLFLLAGWLMQRIDISRHNVEIRVGNSLGLGILLGLIMITKTTAYVALPLAAGVLIWRWWREKAGVRHILIEGLAVAVPAALIALPWYARDIAVYGWPDFLGLTRHDQIVVGQLRAADFVAQQGWRAYWLRAARDTFRSFWGQFGWMGVVLDTRVYFVLLLLSGTALGGLMLRALRRGRRRVPPTLILLGSSVLLTLLVYVWYNTHFLQHQGRYLFTALIPIAIFFCLGWEGALRPGAGRVLAAILVGFGCGLAALGILTGNGLPKWPLALTAAFAAGLLILDLGLRRAERGAEGSIPANDAAPGSARTTPESKLRLLAFALPFVTLPLLDLYALFGGIVPQLTR